jgi:hypothetical protein
MFSRQLGVVTLALVLSAGTARGQGDSRQATNGHWGAAKPGPMSLVDTHDGLAAQFRRLADAATGASATSADRQAFARFVRAAVVPQLKVESVTLFTVFDSLVGGGYAVPATLFDLDAIGYLVKDVERSASGKDRVAFETRAYALGWALDGYFTKVQLLVLPVLRTRLSGDALSAIEARFEESPR